ncbi:MAG: TlpA family protein disulfide reductase, partial [Bacteroidota bacterium]
FSTTIEIERPGFYAVRNEGDNYISFIARENDSIHIRSDYYNFNEFELTGQEEAREITRLHEATEEFLDEVSEYARIVSDSVNSPDYTRIKLEIDKNYRAAFNELKNFSIDFIERNEGSLVSLMALTNQLGRDFFVFHPVEDYEIFQRVTSVLYEKYPESEAVKNLHARVERIKMNYPKEIKHPEVGERAPDFSIKTPEHKSIRLSDLKAKVILLDFWASWCAACREENKKRHSIYKKYHSKGFEIFQISLDNQYKDWTEAISKDSLDWIHGSELNFWESDAAKKYGVNSIPANYLINEHGKIIGRNLSSENIDKMLKEILTKSEL